MRHAFHDAASPPAGPVFVSLPMSMLDAEGDLTVPPRSELDRRTVPAGLDALAALLTDVPVGALAIVAGDEVSASGGSRRARRARRSTRGPGVRRAAALDGSLPARASALRGDARPGRRGHQRFAGTVPARARRRWAHLHGVPLHPGVRGARHRRALAHLARRRRGSVAPIRRSSAWSATRSRRSRRCFRWCAAVSTARR